MKELIRHRATIFVEPVIGYTKDNVDRFPLKEWECMPLANDANPQTINPFEMVSASKGFDGSEWKAINQAKGVVVVFLEHKIDILGQPFVDEHSFVQMSKRAFDRVCQAYAIERVLRFAYNPIYGEKNRDCASMIRHTAYKGASAENVTVRTVYKVDEDINGKKIKINYHVEISSGMFIDEGQRLGSVIYDADINSVAMKDVVFAVSDMDAFFDRVEFLAKEFVEQF